MVGWGGRDLRAEVEGLMSGSHWSRVFRVGIFRQGSVKRCVSQAVRSRNSHSSPQSLSLASSPSFLIS